MESLAIPIKPRETVADLFRQVEAKLQLVWLAGARSADREVLFDTAYRPTLALVGHVDMLERGRLQVLGLTEINLLAAYEPNARQHAIEALFSLDSVAIFVANGVSVPDSFLECAERYATPLISAGVSTAVLLRGLNHQLSQSLAP